MLIAGQIFELAATVSIAHVDPTKPTFQRQGLSNYGQRTTSGTPATFQRCTGKVRKKSTDKKYKNPSINAVTQKT
jgi:hypothetical protein